MSAFLGHIHFWLYKKIRLVIEREDLIYKEAQKSLGDLADELHFVAVDLYGKPIPADRNLEMIIDHSNIHGWLQNQIEIATVREANFIKDLLDCGGEDAEEAILTAFVTQGTACGKVAADELNKGDHTPQEIYQIMQNYYLNGMPCDGGDTILADTADEYVWEGSHANQKGNWVKAGVDQTFMMAAYQAWFQGFVSAADPKFKFTVELIDGEFPQYKIVRA